MEITFTTRTKVLILILSVVVIGNNYSQVLNNDDSSEILGVWVSEEDHSAAWVFSDDGKLSYTLNGELLANPQNQYDSYTITNTCDGNSYPNTRFLKVSYFEGSFQCFEILSFNENNSGVLSLLSLTSGRILVFNKT